MIALSRYTVLSGLLFLTELSPLGCGGRWHCHRVACSDTSIVYGIGGYSYCAFFAQNVQPQIGTLVAFRCWLRFFEAAAWHRSLERRFILAISFLHRGVSEIVRVTLLDAKESSYALGAPVGSLWSACFVHKLVWSRHHARFRSRAREPWQSRL